MHKYTYDNLGLITASTAIGVIVGAQIQKYVLNKQEAKGNKQFSAEDAPDWLSYLFSSEKHKRIVLPEWEDSTWRSNNGWVGKDLIHNRSSKAVFIPCYFYNSDERTLVGMVHFGENCESHRGLCHGGSMTSVMDDVCGHVAFLASGSHAKPWRGATVQVDVKLKKPIRIGQWLKITGKVVRIERKRKLFIFGELSDENGNVYAEMNGISICGVDLSNMDDAVSKRQWIVGDKSIETTSTYTNTAGSG